MGVHGDSTSFIYRNPPKITIPPISIQRQMIDLAKRGVELNEICKSTSYYLPTVKLIVERGVVFLKENDTPVKCGKCGARLKASPCLRCELVEQF